MKTKILKYLKDSGDYVSGQQLSKMLNVSRNAIWKSINSLKNDGYIIDSVTNKGYKLISVPDILTESEIKSGLKTRRIGNEIIALQQVDSTNEEIKRRAKQGAPHGLVCTAEEQTIGKGRLGRTWVSPPGEGIWVSVLLRLPVSPAEVSGITLAAGLAVCKAVTNVTGLSAKIKWPNDVLIDNKKVCGILTEMAAELDAVDYLVCGIGINANNKSFPDDIAHKATSIYLQLGKEINRSELLRELLYLLELYTDEFAADAAAEFLEEYKSLCVTLGRQVTVTRGGKAVQGTAADVTKSGALIVTGENGERLEITSGEVTVQGIY
ncbi:MAG: biotin--[acetyl-CoA-carboxylase] ligase [Acutalibacteraceae bacterium]